MRPESRQLGATAEVLLRAISMAWLAYNPNSHYFHWGALKFKGLTIYERRLMDGIRFGIGIQGPDRFPFAVFSAPDLNLRFPG